jgi:hypothetical protein
MNPQDTPFTNVRDQHQLPFDLDGSFGWLMELPFTWRRSRTGRISHISCYVPVPTQIIVIATGMGH